MNLRSSASILLALLLTPALALASGGSSDPEAPPPKPLTPASGPVAPSSPSKAQPDPRLIDMVICLDTSGSMSALIDSCRRKLWDLCTELAQAQPAPTLRVALLTYGSGQDADGGYVVLQKDFTDELDQIYERLFALQTEGGTELVGRVMHESLERLSWSPSSAATPVPRMLFVAGNESAFQDPQYDAKRIAQRARAAGILVNTIYCGVDNQGGEPTGWRQVAAEGGGEYAAIDPTNIINVKTPYDAELTRLGTEINSTYLAFGQSGAAQAENQLAQDANAARLSSDTAAARAQLKGSRSGYCNSSWDLVDACRDQKIDLASLKEEELPELLRGKSLEEQRVLLRELQERRSALQAKIQALGKQRSAFIQAEEAKQAQATGRQGLGAALVAAVKKQVSLAGFRFSAEVQGK